MCRCMRRFLRVGIVQPKIISNNLENLRQIERIFKKLMEERPEIIVFPERWFYIDMANITKENVRKSSQKQLKFCQSLAKTYSLPLVTGAIWTYCEDIQEFQSVAYYINEKGDIAAQQPKIQLYGLERKYLFPGNYVQIIEDSHLDLKFSILICFDLNISNDLARIVSLNGAEIIFNPVLIMKEGNLNWNYYIHTRALENRIPIVACNSIASFSDRQYSGQSKFISFKPGAASPVTLITKEIPISENWAVSDINLQFPNEIRELRLNERHNLEKLKILMKKV